MSDVDVVVIGAGATGAGVARDLALRGASVALVDRATSPTARAGATMACCTAAAGTWSRIPRPRPSASVRTACSGASRPTASTRAGGCSWGSRGTIRLRPQLRGGVRGGGNRSPAHRSREALEKEPGLTEKVREASWSRMRPWIPSSCAWRTPWMRRSMEP